jgi:hypothetical protein
MFGHIFILLQQIQTMLLEFNLYNFSDGAKRLITRFSQPEFHL